MSQLYVDNIRNRTGGPIGIPTGAVVTGVLTATTGNITGNITIGGTVTYEDVTNIDSVGIITARSDVSIADKIIHTGDTNTAIRFPSVDTFTAETSGTERFRITPTGLIGIGSDGPTRNVDINNDSGDTFISAKSQNTGFAGLLLGDQEADNRGQVTYDNNDDSMVIHTAQAERLRITSTGNVGIGTSVPQTIFHIEASVPGIRLSDTGNAGAYAFFDANAANAIIHADKDNEVSDSRVAFAVDNDEKMRIDSSGNIFTAGTDSTSAIEAGTQAGKVFKNNHTASSGATSTSQSFHFSFANPNGFVGSISTNGSNTSFNTSSDYRLKENVVDLEGAINRVKQLLPKRFNFIADADTTVDGFLAHEAQTVVPEAVTGSKDEVDDEGNPVRQCVDYSKFVPVLTGALQEAIAKIESLEKRIKSLES